MREQKEKEEKQARVQNGRKANIKKARKGERKGVKKRKEDKQ